MVHVTARYNDDYLTPGQIDLIHADLRADLGALAEMDAEPEAGSSVPGTVQAHWAERGAYLVAAPEPPEPEPELEAGL